MVLRVRFSSSSRMLSIVWQGSCLGGAAAGRTAAARRPRARTTPSITDQPFAAVAVQPVSDTRAVTRPGGRPMLARTRVRVSTRASRRTCSSPPVGPAGLGGTHSLEDERGTAAAGQVPTACRIVINDAGSRPDRLDAAHTGVAEEPGHSASLMLGTTCKSAARFKTGCRTPAKMRKPHRPGSTLFAPGCSPPRHPEWRQVRNPRRRLAGTTSTFAIPGGMASGRPSPTYDRVVERRRAVAMARHFREAEGLSNAQIAVRLGRSPATVKAYFYDPSDANKGPSWEREAESGGRELRSHPPAAASRGDVLPRRTFFCARLAVQHHR